MASGDDIDTFNILVASDLHLGYCERDAKRREDSFITFEEILSQANDLKVDLILFGGDLFHDNKPSRHTLHSCLRLLRKYCLGDNPIRFEFVSDQNDNFGHCAFANVNYEDPNLNVSIPVFTIHGNHDDPAAAGLGAMDLLSVTGLVNYFGKCGNLDDIVVSPLLLKKGRSKLALYGMGSIRDERLYRAFIEKKVRMLRPSEDTNDWFNIFVLHQNRVKHGLTNYIPENFLDNFLNLVIWGHEHECRIEFERTGTKDFYISQPGSSIATSLCPGEAKPKHVGLLKICDKRAELTTIPLETVRPFYFEHIVLKDTSIDFSQGDSQKKVMDYCSARVDEIVRKARVERSGNAKQPKLPLVRLRIEYEESNQMFSQHRFAQKFINSVANPKDIILFQRKKTSIAKNDEEKFDVDALNTGFDNLEATTFTAFDLVKEYFELAGDKKKMMLLQEKMFSEAIQEFVEKEEREAINDFVKYQEAKCRKYLEAKKVNNENELNVHIEQYRQTANNDDTANEMEMIKEARKKAAPTAKDDEMMICSTEGEDDDDDEEEEKEREKSVKARGRGRGRAVRGTAAARSAAGRGTRARGRRGSGVATGSRSSSSRRQKLVDFEQDENDDNWGPSTSASSRSTRNSKQVGKGISYVDNDTDSDIEF